MQQVTLYITSRFNFYLHNRLDNFYQKRPAEGFLLIGTNDAEKYLPEFEKEGYQFEEVYESLNEYSGK